MKIEILVFTTNFTIHNHAARLAIYILMKIEDDFQIDWLKYQINFLKMFLNSCS